MIHKDSNGNPISQEAAELIEKRNSLVDLFNSEQDPSIKDHLGAKINVIDNTLFEVYGLF